MDSLFCWTCVAIEPLGQELYGQEESKVCTQIFPVPFECLFLYTTDHLLYFFSYIFQPISSFGQTIHLTYDLSAAEEFKQTKAKTTKLTEWPNTVVLTQS